jgi:hypothetical protein
MKIDVVDWFNPYDHEHIDAYKHLMEHGMWPEGFIPDNVEMSLNWNIKLMAIMTDCWINSGPPTAAC